MLISLQSLREKYLPDTSERWIREMVRRGVIPVVRVAGRVLVDPEQVMQALRAGSRTSTATAGQGR